MEKVKATVRFFGDDIGFQFSQTGQGSRTRKAIITNIRRATEKELDEIHETWRHSHEDRYGQKTRKRRLFWWEDPNFKVYVGKSSFRFRGEDPRHAKVGCVLLKGSSLNKCRWESYKPIYK